LSSLVRQRANEPGSLTWNENLSRDFDGNKAFYHALFGYEYGDMSDGGFRYATMKVGGIGELDSSYPADVPAHWPVYFSVEDTDTAVAEVTSPGGTTIRPPWDTPYGRMAIVADDHGAVFSVIMAPGDNA
jgi:predicted enzyme related to lactoylglutathione lyase